MIKIFDTTLRDGGQNADVNFTLRDKIEIVKALDEFGADYIEIGWPGSNPKDMEAFLEVSKLNLKSKISAFCSTRKKENKASEDGNLLAVLKSKAAAASMFGKSWILHVEKQLKIDKEEYLNVIEDSVKFLKENGLEVVYDLEHYFDGFKDNSDYALRCLEAAFKGGAKTLVLCETNGGMMTDELIETIKKTKEFMESKKIDAELGIHCHNDSGLAVANTLAAVDLGIKHIQGTINGIGERTGNADLCQIIPNLIIKKGYKTNVNLKDLTKLSRLVYTLSNIKPNNNQPYVGKNSFANKGGIHVDAIAKIGAEAYSHIDPKLIGNTLSIVLSDLSGKANILEILKGFGYDGIDKKDPRVIAMLKDVEEMEKKMYDIGTLKAEQFLLVHKHFKDEKRIFSIGSGRIMSEFGKGMTDSEKGDYSECVLIGKVDGKQREVIAPLIGEGPVNATFQAMRKIIATGYKEIEEVRLLNFKVRIAEDKGIESSVRVFVEFGSNGEEWGAVGVNTNILLASKEAIEKGFRYYLLK